jgi:hypothetical protein
MRYKTFMEWMYYIQSYHYNEVGGVIIEKTKQYYENRN